MNNTSIVAYVPNNQLHESSNTTQLNKIDFIIAKINLLNSQNRKFDCIKTITAGKSITDYSIVKNTTLISGTINFYLPKSLNSIENKQIIELTPSIISYYSKGDSFNINGWVSTNGILLTKNIIYFMNYVYDWLQWESFRPNKYILSCKDFAIGYALDKFKLKDINTADKFLNHPFFNSKSIENKQQLEDLRHICGPILINYSVAIFLQASLLTRAEVIEVANTIYNYNIHIDSNQAKQLKERFLEIFPINSKLSPHDFMQYIMFMVSNNYSHSIATAILTKKPLCGLDKYNFTDEALMCVLNKKFDCDLGVKKTIESIDYSRCSSFSINSFPALLQNIASKFLQQQEKNISNFIWLTDSHVMTLRLKKKDSGLKILFFDPGIDTARTKNILIKDINELKQININTFLSSELIKKLNIESKNFDHDTHSCNLLSADISQKDIDTSIIQQSRTV